MRSTGNRRSRSRGRASSRNREAKSAQARANLYDEVTQRIVGELGAGCVPWVQPWGSAPGAPDMCGQAA